MDDVKGKILWVDDEIEMLRPHIRFLTERGYDVETAANGEDAVNLVRETGFDLVFLDEMMTGMGGLRTLAEIKEMRPNLPVVMVTKNEEESLMEEAIGVKISDYLTKPVNPSQILMACKKFLEGKKITSAAVSKDYIQEFNKISLQLMGGPGYEEWIDIYARLTGWAMELDEHPELGLKQTLQDQTRECNLAFGKYIERHYRDWMEQTTGRPVLSLEVVDRFVIPELQSSKSVFFFVIDCLRLDQWMVMEAVLQEYFQITKQYLLQHTSDGDSVLAKRDLQRFVPVRCGASVSGALGEERGRRKQPEPVRAPVPGQTAGAPQDASETRCEVRQDPGCRIRA